MLRRTTPSRFTATGTQTARRMTADGNGKGNGHGNGNGNGNGCRTSRFRATGTQKTRKCGATLGIRQRQWPRQNRREVRSGKSGPQDDGK
jgi:hypothetical protein